MENRFKQALAAGRKQIGLWLGFADAHVAEVAAGSGFDWLLIDGEHAPNDVRSVLDQLRAIESRSRSAPVVRPVNGDAALLKQLLDIGCQNLLVPMVETAEQAAALVRAVRYPPHGVRGVGTALARAANWGRDTSYFQTANDGICLLLQVESVKGLENLEAIANTPGVDGVFIGPSDLAASLGYLGQPGHPEVKAIVEKSLKAIAAAGKAPGILAADPTLARDYLEVGALFVAVGVDTVLYARATQALAASFNDVMAPPPPGAAY